MSIATDPNSVSLDDSDDGFAKHFDEFASGKKPDPDQEEPKEAAASEGNGPKEEPAAPADEDEPEPEGDEPKEAATEEAATEEGKPSETATSDTAKPEGGSQPPEGGTAPDPWENAPAELKAQFETVQKERDEARHRAQSDASRVAALGRKLQQLSAGQTSGAPAPDAKPTEAQQALDAKIKQLREDYGEIADPLIELIEGQRKELTHVQTSLAGLNEVQQAQTIAQETAALEARHPDWRAIAQSPEFDGWIGIQPENIQRLATSWDARETSVVLTLFKAERMEATGQKEQPKPQAEAKPKAEAATGERRSQQLDGGRDVRSRPAPAASGPPDDFDAAFKYYEEKRRLAKNLSVAPTR